MRLIAALVVALGLALVPSPANAAPAECDTTITLPGLVCVTVDSTGKILDSAGNVIGTTITDLPTPIKVTVTAPAPPPLTATATRTNTVTRTATATITESPAPVTQTATATATQTRTVFPTGQSGSAYGTVVPKPDVPVPGPVDAGIHLIPKDPDTAAAAGSLVGLFVGIIMGLIGLFVAYRRGQIDGEKATLREFLGVIRGEPQPGRHRA